MIDSCKNLIMGSDESGYIGVTIRKRVQKRLAEVGKTEGIGLSINKVADRALAWFGKQEPAVWAMILNGAAPGMEDLHIQAIERIAADMRKRQSQGEAKIPSIRSEKSINKTGRDTRSV